jgi:hypothetical protein
VSLALLTPFTGASGTQSAGRWRKKLLPFGEISYKGRTLKFDRDYLGGLVNSFQGRAYDQVPFQLAGDENKHTNDVERTGGQITGMSLGDDGLYIEVAPTQRGQQVLADNPGVGVSARIIEGYDRSDGKFFPRAIQHVLATLDPRIPGMGGWEAVAASNDAEITFDLSGEQFQGEEPGMPELTDDQQARLAKLLNLDPDRLGELVASMEPGDGGSGQTPPGDAGDGEDEIAQIAAAIDGMSDEELAALEAELEAEEAGAQPEGEPATAGAAALTGEAAMALELAQATGDENARQLGIIQGQLDHERWEGEKARLVTGGTPPYIADLAQPLLEGAGHVVDLSGGKSVDAGQIVRSILAEYQKLGQQLGLGVELGTVMDEPGTESEEAKSRDEVVSRAKAQLFGMR